MPSLTPIRIFTLRMQIKQRHAGCSMQQAALVVPHPDKQDKCVNEIIFCHPKNGISTFTKIFMHKNRRNIFYRTKTAENNF
jgi:hypothetical protein